MPPTVPPRVRECNSDAPPRKCAVRVAASLAVVVTSLFGPGCAASSDADASSSGDAEEGTEASTSSATAGAAPDTSTSGSAEEASTSALPSTSAEPSTSDDTGSPPSGCKDGSLQPGTHHDLEMDFEGQTQRYDLIVPDSYDPSAPTPLVLNFHGFSSNPQQQALFSLIEPVAQAHGVLVALPWGGGNSWNGGLCCGEGMTTDRDDVGFSRALVQELESQLCVDSSRIYAMGMSNGGYMSHRLACEAADLFAAIGPVAGVLGIPPDDCAPERPISVMHFHGTADGLVPYDGGGITGTPSVSETMSGWAERNGCDPTPELTFEQGDVHCETWPGCSEGVEVTLCTVEAGGHCWPGNTFCPFGTSTTNIDASEELALFFEKHSL